MRRSLLILIMTSLVVGLDLLWVGQWPTMRLVMNVTLLWVLTVTLTNGLIAGLLVAGGAGLVWSLVTVISGPAYYLAFFAAVLVSWLFSTKVVTSRSAISFISTVAVGTAAYFLALIGNETVLSLINHQRLRLPLEPLIVAVVVQFLVHPLLMTGLWRLIGRDRYAQVSSAIHRSF